MAASRCPRGRSVLLAARAAMKREAIKKLLINSNILPPAMKDRGFYDSDKFGRNKNISGRALRAPTPLCGVLQPALGTARIVLVGVYLKGAKGAYGKRKRPL
ncbi:hypothetical protein EVAR_12199_1 [Eumeta japonica]|uniref:Uncharacterized protein n=1 Tax=Eumeta variegata TaxID=151549 RepID=A0A4C1UHV9_EUMVA|nr:hypothetical protein EVAR_12199_1 [Eumeta japonica]